MSPLMHADPADTRRQREVLTLLCQGDSNKEIAAKLRVSESDVKYHVSRLLRAYEVDNRVELVLKVIAARTVT